MSVGREGNAARRDRWGEHQVGDHAPPPPATSTTGWVRCLCAETAGTHGKRKETETQSMEYKTKKKNIN